jgi:hypothetical protein
MHRDAIVATIPRRYSPAIHLLVPSAIGLGVLVAALSLLEALRPIELLTVPITLVLGFGFEWRAHKDILHRRLPLLGELYERHELQHHVVYTYDGMQLRSPRELRLILMPAYAVVLVFALDMPLAFGVAALASRNAALLFVATSMVFFLAYEWLHMAYHLPEASPAYRLPLLRRLREVHRRHHDPRLMKRWNFNVTIPLFDVIHGTLWSPARARGLRGDKPRCTPEPPEREAERGARRRRG